jgi:hypothetical protein
MSALRKVHGFNFPKRWPTGLEIAAHQDRMIRVAARTPTPTRLGTPTIKDQGNSAECFGFAAVQAIHIELQAQGKPSTLLSPVLPYWGARREETDADTDLTDSGSDPDGMTKAIADIGACPWDEDPFDEAKLNDRPNDTAFLAAQQHRCTILPILATGNALYDAIQHVICIERHPVLIALQVVPAFDNPGTDGVIDDPTGKSRGLHAQCLFGVDQRGFVDDANSWGLGQWTPNGCASLTPRFIAGAVVWAGSLQVNP